MTRRRVQAGVESPTPKAVARRPVVPGREGIGYVTKADVRTYLRCPYELWLRDSGEPVPGDAAPERELLRRQGEDFEASVFAAEPRTIGHAALAASPSSDGDRGKVGEILHNDDLRLRGRPDMVIRCDGRWEPLEVKAHARLTAADRMELAFYWLLLATYRSPAEAAAPAAWVVLRVENALGQPERVELTARDLANARRAIAGVRRLRGARSAPPPCPCHAREELIRSRGVRALSGIGRQAGAKLEQIGILVLDDVAELDLAELDRRWQTAFGSPTPATVVRALLHDAKAKAGDMLLRIGEEPFPAKSSFVALDLEYVSGAAGPLWVVAVQAVPTMTEPVVWGPGLSETALLRRLGGFLRAHAGPVITWGGDSADVPAVRGAGRRTAQRAAMEQLTARHRDLKRWVEMNLCLPTIGRRLDDVAEWLNVAVTAQISNGLHAQQIWHAYQRTADRDLARQLAEYASSDVTKLVAVTQALQTLVPGAAVVEPMPEADPTRRRRTRRWEVGDSVEWVELPGTFVLPGRRRAHLGSHRQ